MNDYTTYSDEQLLSLLKNSDEAAFEELYKRYWEKLYVVAANKLRNVIEAEDIVQDIMADVWKRRMSISLSAPLPVYLAIAVKYKVTKVLAKQSHQHKYEDHYIKHRLSVDNSLENWLDAEFLQEELSRKIQTLPQKCTLIFQLSRNYYLSNSDIAKKLDISEKTVEGHLTKALRLLRKGMAFFSFLFIF